ncbi:MAG: hypothetical protein ABIE94_06505 [archaeon]
MKDLILAVKAKKELRNLDDEFVKSKINAFFKKNPEIKKRYAEKKSFKEFCRSKDYSKIVKPIRKELREIYGVFILDNKPKRILQLLDLEKNPVIDNYNKMLKMHQSTKERLPYYSEIYENIFKITGKAKTILDVACGLNPFSYPYLKFTPKYIATELASDDCLFLEEYFKRLEIDGMSFAFDLLDKNAASMLKKLKADVCFMFKTLDSLETVERNISEKLIKAVNCKYLVVSFPTVSIGGKKSIKQERRVWLEKMLEKMKKKYKTFSVSNEVFYVVKK